MAYDEHIADRIRIYLADFSRLKVEEKKMFRGLTFMINGKMCISVSGINLMCRYDPERQTEVEKRKGFRQMIMKGREYKGFCYVSPEGYTTKNNFEYWVNLCLDFNAKAKASKKSPKSAGSKKGI
jgi:TfoX N-terminal domain